ncbi:MAG: hypothetical protein SFT90_02785 [Rickettsiales bacterium]|nr:hypothetical protein [Rickettsiales bacterium]
MNNEEILLQYPLIKKLIDSNILLLEDGLISLNKNRFLTTKLDKNVPLFKFKENILYSLIHNEEKLYYPENSSQRDALNVRDNGCYIGLANSYKEMIKRYGGHTYGFFSYDGKNYEQAHFTKLNPSIFSNSSLANLLPKRVKEKKLPEFLQKSVLNYFETLLVKTRGLVAEYILDGDDFEGRNYGFTNAVIFRATHESTEHYEIDVFLDALRQALPPKDRLKYQAFSAGDNCFNCSRYQLNAFKKIGINFQEIFNIKKYTFSPGNLGKRMEKKIDSLPLTYEVELPNKSVIKIYSSDKFIILKGNEQTKELVMLPDGTNFNISADFIAKKIPINKLLGSKGYLGRISISEQDMIEHQNYIKNDKQLKSGKTPYILDILDIKTDGYQKKNGQSSRR